VVIQRLLKAAALCHFLSDSYKRNGFVPISCSIPSLSASLSQRRTAARAENDVFSLLARTVLMGTRVETSKERPYALESAHLVLQPSFLENGLRCAYSSFRRKISHISTGERRSTRRASDRSGVCARNRCVIAVWLESSKD